MIGFKIIYKTNKMPSIDTLLGLSVNELKSLTDEQLLEFYKDVFILEPVSEIVVEVKEEKVKQPKKPKVVKDKSLQNSLFDQATMAKMLEEVKAKAALAKMEMITPTLK